MNDLRQVLHDADHRTMPDLSDDELLRLHRDLSVMRILIEDDDRFKKLKK